MKNCIYHRLDTQAINSPPKRGNSSWTARILVPDRIQYLRQRSDDIDRWYDYQCSRNLYRCRELLVSQAKCYTACLEIKWRKAAGLIRQVYKNQNEKQKVVRGLFLTTFLVSEKQYIFW